MTPDRPDQIARLRQEGDRLRPGIRIDEARFVERCAALVDLRGALAFAGDLTVAWGCLEEDATALRMLETDFIRSVPGFLRRFDRRPGFSDDVCQTVREKLLVARPPRLESYLGSGPLLGWLRVVAVRTAIDLMRAQGDEPRPRGEELVATIAAAGDDPEFALAQARFREPFEHVLREAVAGLTPRHRGVLRLYYLKGLNIEAIGRIYGTHRATIARWIATCHETLGAEVRRNLDQQFHLDSRDCRSLARFLGSRLHLDLQAELGRSGTI
jgi:RNA polymerase sigma-70 factor (ECF subfamily)